MPRAPSGCVHGAIRRWPSWAAAVVERREARPIHEPPCDRARASGQLAGGDRQIWGGARAPLAHPALRLPGAPRLTSAALTWDPAIRRERHNRLDGVAAQRSLDRFAAHSKGYSPPSSRTSLTARPRSVCGYLVVLVISPSSQRTESPIFPGRFTSRPWRCAMGTRGRAWATLWHAPSPPTTSSRCWIRPWPSAAHLVHPLR